MDTPSYADSRNDAEALRQLRIGDGPRPLFRNVADDMLRAARRHWPVVALITLAVALLAYLAAAMQPKQYRAVAIGAVAPRVKQMQIGDVLHGVDTLERRVVVATVAALVSTPLTLRQVHADPKDHVDAVVVPTTNLFRITVEGTDPRRISAVANAIPAAVSEQTHAMYEIYTVTLLSPALAPDAAELPRTGRALIAGFVLGAVLAMATAYFLDRRHRAAS
ncbi:MAG: hypothetical protein JO315_19715 [Acidobacteria bacterium]|nr:hypothetical protein [Acidobacteriota bacterium]